MVLLDMQDNIAESTHDKGSVDEWYLQLENLLFQGNPSVAEVEAGQLHTARQSRAHYHYFLLICMGSNSCPTDYGCAAINGLQGLYKQLLAALPAPTATRRLNQPVHQAHKVGQV